MRKILMSVLFVVTEVTAVGSSDGPMRVVAEERLSPFDAEVLATFAKSRSRSLQPVTGSAAAVAGGGADVAAGLYADAVTNPDLAATREVFPSRLVAVTLRPSPRVAAIEALRKTRIGAVRGSRAPEALREAKVNGAEVIEYRSLDAALSALRGGTVASLVVELPEALLAKHDDGQLDLGVFLGTRRSCVYAVRSRDQALLAELNAYLQRLRATPSWMAIIVRHYGQSGLEALSRALLAE